MKLYRYRKFNTNTLNEIVNQEWFASSVLDFNDPFELAFNEFNPLETDHGSQQVNEVWGNTVNIYKEGIKEYKEQGGIVCLSKRFDNILMWGHYADSHQGICIEYEVPKGDIYFNEHSDKWHSGLRYREVYYPETNEFPEITGFTDNMHLILSTKSKDWSYEEEVRFFTGQLGISSSPKITKIFTGVAFKESNLNMLKKASQQIPIVELKKDDSEYKLIQ